MRKCSRVSNRVNTFSSIDAISTKNYINPGIRNYRLHGFTAFLSEDICNSTGHTSKSSTSKFWPIISADRCKSRGTSHSQIDRYLWLNWRWDICTGLAPIRMSQLHTWPDISPLISIDGSRGLNSTINNGDDDFRHITGLFGFSALDNTELHFAYFKNFCLKIWYY